MTFCIIIIAPTQCVQNLLKLIKATLQSDAYILLNVFKPMKQTTKPQNFRKTIKAEITLFRFFFNHNLLKYIDDNMIKRHGVP